MHEIWASVLLLTQIIVCDYSSARGPLSKRKSCFMLATKFSQRATPPVTVAHEYFRLKDPISFPEPAFPL